MSNHHIFNVDATNTAKGFAVLLLLLHHLFYTHPEYGYYLHIAALEAKSCVTLFVLLSGYGLAASYKPGNLPVWYWKRFTKLYMNYWYIMLIFIPISWLGFGNSLYTVFSGDTVTVWLKFLSQIAGLHIYFAGYGFNPTWWFISAIIVLYLLFPAIYSSYAYLRCHATRFPLLSKLLFLSALILAFRLLPHYCFTEYIPAFSLGIIAAQEGWFNRFLCSRTSPGMFFIWILCGIAVLLQAGPHPAIPLLAKKTIFYLIIALMFCRISARITATKIRWLYVPLRFLGIHSMNIFLMHTFIYAIFFRNFFYSLPNPAVMYLALLVSVTTVSAALMLLQKISRYDKLIKATQQIFSKSLN